MDTSRPFKRRFTLLVFSFFLSSSIVALAAHEAGASINPKTNLVLFEKMKVEKLKSLGAKKGDVDDYSTGYGYRLALNDHSFIQTVWSVSFCNKAIACRNSDDRMDSTLCQPAYCL